MPSMAIILAGLVWTVLRLFVGTRVFVPEACTNLGALLRDQIVGQDMAQKALVDSVCHHLYMSKPGRTDELINSGYKGPLVVSIHGPPGVGKSQSTYLAARALYNMDPNKAVECPGSGCKGAKWLSGLNFAGKSEAQQMKSLRDSIEEHVRNTLNPLIIVPEYDKLPCASRTLLRHVFTHPDAWSQSLYRQNWESAIIMLESNAGYLDLQGLVDSVGDRSLVDLGSAQEVVRDEVFAMWREDKCEEDIDTQRLISRIQLWVPYLSLEKPQIRELSIRELERRREAVAHQGKLTWNCDVVDFMVDQVELTDGHSEEGAIPVHRVAMIHIDPAIRRCPEPVLETKWMMLAMVARDGSEPEVVCI